MEVLKDRKPNIKEGVNKSSENVDNTKKNIEESADNKNEDLETDNLDFLNSLKKGQELDVLNYEIKTSETTPPSRYNSGINYTSNGKCRKTYRG